MKAFDFHWELRHRDYGQGVEETVWEILRDCALSDPDVRVHASVLRSFHLQLDRFYNIYPFYEDIKISVKFQNMLAFLQDRAIKDPEVQVRVLALMGIAQFNMFMGDSFRLKYPQTLECLIENLAFLRQQAEENIETYTRSEALLTIAAGLSGDTQALAFLQDRATKDPDSQTRLAGVMAIASCWSHDPQVVAFLRDWETNETEKENRLIIDEMLKDPFFREKHWHYLRIIYKDSFAIIPEYDYLQSVHNVFVVQ